MSQILTFDASSRCSSPPCEFEIPVCACARIFAVIRLTNTMRHRDGVLSPFLLSRFLRSSSFSRCHVLFALWMSEEDKSNNKKKRKKSSPLHRVGKQSISLRTHTHTSIQSKTGSHYKQKKVSLARLLFPGVSPRDSINKYSSLSLTHIRLRCCIDHGRSEQNRKRDF